MAEEGALSTTANNWSMPIFSLFKDARLVFKLDELGLEIIRIALPAAMALAADPIASLIDTAFIGHIGPVEVAAVGVSIAIFNQASRITIFPLVSITTSFVAEEDTMGKAKNNDPDHNIQDIDEEYCGSLSVKRELTDLEKNTTDSTAAEPPQQQKQKEMVLIDDLENGSSRKAAHETQNSRLIDCCSLDNLDQEETSDQATSVVVEASSATKENIYTRPHIPSASTAMIIGLSLGLFQAIFLVVGAKFLLRLMGIKPGTPMLKPALEYLTLRSLGSPAVLLSLAMQGIFRGFKDTKTPLYATVAGDVLNVILDPILIFACRMGVSGAAIAHVVSQYFMSLILLWRLMKKVDLVPPNLKALQFRRFLHNGFLLLARVVAVTFCVTLAASMAARLGSVPMAAFQICLQVWMTSSLLADGLAVAGQAILAGAFAEKNHKKATAAASRVLQMGFVLGLGLAVVVGVGLHFGDRIFSKDASVLNLIAIGIPFVAATQPINTLAFVFDGVNFGASDFAYSAYSMVLVAIASIASLFVLSRRSNGFIGIWLALTIYMVLRAFAGLWRIGTGTGPWRFLRERHNL